MTSDAVLAMTKGHGTENDFVLLDDRDGAVDLSPELVRALTDRHAGVGGDGVIRLVGTTALPEGAASLSADPAAAWFMDYRNADGSVAEMCGNGVRVVARFAEHLGLWDGTGELVLGTRAGIRRVRRTTDPSGAGAVWYAVDMGPWRLTGGDEAAAAGMDAEVLVAGLEVARPALSIDVGNPHTVLALAEAADLDAADLTTAPRVEPQPPHGTNVELVVPLGEATLADGDVVGRLRMRVHERGVGETRSCGTGACAAALAVRVWAGAGAPVRWLVDVPGGQVAVRLLEGGHVELAGPATLVAEVQVDLAALARRTNLSGAAQP
ncbi:MAG: diaminopimelate epimerase [Actinotalea sp.]|nr:diaminopimelate epimerase [Actinotalea sp.]